MSAKRIHPMQPGGSELPVPENPQPHLEVLHVEDNPDDQLLFQRACQNASVPFGWHVADTATKALDYLQALITGNDNSQRWPDLVVLDVGMPEGGGLKVLEYIRATPQLRGLPVVVLTGQANPDLMQQAYGLGANSFLAKPANLAQMSQLASSLYGIWSIARRSGVSQS
jgi:two-component system response regulator